MPRPSLVIGGIGLLAMVPIGYGLMYRLGLGAPGSGMTSAISCWLQLGLFLAFMRASPRYRGLGWGRGRRGPVTEAIQERFFQIVKGELPDTHGWLQFVHSPATSGVSKGR